MYRNLFCLVAVIGLMLVGCTEKASQNALSEPEKVCLESIEFINDSLLEKPKSLVVTDDAIVLGNSATMNDSLISIFNLNGDFVRSCMPHGPGPMEVRDISGIQYSESDNCIYVTDLQLYDYKIFRVSDYLKPSMAIEDVFSYSAVNNDSIMLFQGAIRLSNGQIVAGNANPAGMLVIFDKDGNPLRLFGHVPDKSLIDDKLSDFGNSTIYHPYIAVNPKGDFAAIYYDVSDMRLIINVIDNKADFNFVKGEAATGIYPSEVAPGVCVGATTEKTFWHTQGLSLSNNYMYQLYIGLTREDLGNTDFFKDAKHFGANTVRVYDRKGNHVKTITLDRWATALAVSPDDSYLYTLTQSSEDGYTVLRYEL